MSPPAGFRGPPGDRKPAVPTVADRLLSSFGLCWSMSFLCARALCPPTPGIVAARRDRQHTAHARDGELVTVVGDMLYVLRSLAIGVLPRVKVFSIDLNVSEGWFRIYGVLKGTFSVEGEDFDNIQMTADAMPSRARALAAAPA